MSCSPGAYLGETDVPMEAGIVLLHMSIEYAFTTLNMSCLETSVFKTNKPSMVISKYLGYKEISGSDEFYHKNGKEEIAVRLEISKEDWLERKKHRTL